MSTHEWITMHRDREAAFAVDEADDPLRIELTLASGFLLIVRTGRIVTAHRRHPTKRV